MTPTKQFAIRCTIFTLIIVIFIVTPLALFLTTSPFHDIMDYERWGLCDGLTTAEDCDEYVTQSVLFWRHNFPLVLEVVFLPLLAVYLLIELLVYIFWKLKSKFVNHSSARDENGDFVVEAFDSEED